MKIINNKKLFSILFIFQIIIYTSNQVIAQKSDLEQNTIKNLSEQHDSLSAHLNQDEKILPESSKPPNDIIINSEKNKQTEPVKVSNTSPNPNYHTVPDKSKTSHTQNATNSKTASPQTTNSKLARTPSKTVNKPTNKQIQNSSSLKNSEPDKQVDTNISKSEEKQEETVTQNSQEQRESSNNSFEFIKSDKFKGSFFEDENLLLYGGIFLIIVSILGLFITFMPRKKRSRKRN